MDKQLVTFSTLSLRGRLSFELHAQEISSTSAESQVTHTAYKMPTEDIEDDDADDYEMPGRPL